MQQPLSSLAINAMPYLSNTYSSIVYFAQLTDVGVAAFLKPGNIQRMLALPIFYL